MNSMRNVFLGAAIACLAACASAPKRVAELDEARAEFERVSQDPLAREAAAVRLDKAQQQLRVAEAALAERQPLAVIQQQAYLARRNAQVAGEQIAERRARQQVEAGQAARDRVLLEARTAEAERAKAQADAARLRAESAGAAALSASAEAERLRSDLAALQAKQTERGMVLTLGDVLFDTGQATLKPGAAVTLDRVASFLTEQSEYKVLIEGHTDSRGSGDYNFGLSERRADTVRGALVSRGIAGERVRARGLGEDYPVASNDNAAGQQQNRRVEIVFSDQGGNFPAAAERSPVAGQ